MTAPAPWETILLDAGIVPADLHPCRRAKFPKTVPWRFPELCGFDYTVWMDGNLQIVDPGLIEIIRNSTVNGFSFSPHFARDCIYKEARVSAAWEKYAGEPIVGQAAHYWIQGMPGKWGLIEAGIIGRDLTHPLVRQIGDRWLDEILRWSFQDQISLPYVLWRVGVETGRLPQPWRSYGWASWVRHQR